MNFDARPISWVGILAPILALFFAVSTYAQSVDSLISALGDPDAQLRENAAAELVRKGSEARPAVIAASRSVDAMIASGASRVLLSLPWYRDDDPPLVRQLLADYGAADEPGRIVIVSQLTEMNGNAGIPALLRLICEDPSQDVCWMIVKMFPDPREARVERATPVRDPRSAKLGAIIRKLDPPDTCPAALVLAAHAWMGKDLNRSVGLLRRAVATETDRPSYDDGELDFAFDTLADYAVGQHRYDEAAELRRLQARRIGLTRDQYPTPVFHLLVLQAKYGPLAGFDDDVRAFGRYLGYPQAMYALSQAFARSGQTGQALAFEAAARAASFSTDSREVVFKFLVSVGWIDLARRELYAVLGCDDPEAALDCVNSRLLLAKLAEVDDCFAQSAEHFTAAQVLRDQIKGDLHHIGRRGRMIRFDPPELVAKIALCNARIAQARGDDKAVRQNLDQLMQAGHCESEFAMKAFDLLKSVGRNDDAVKLFNAAYAEAFVQLSELPDDAILMNAIAWLCARCDQKLTEALDLASRAVAAEPENAAFLDTLAEVNFHLGRCAEAVKHETRALELQPDDEFMTKQLQRFKSAKP